MPSVGSNTGNGDEVAMVMGHEMTMRCASSFGRTTATNA